MKIVIHGLHNFDDKQIDLITRSLMKGEGVLSSQVFKKKILLGGYTQARGYSPLEIYDLILSGADPRGDGNPADQVLDIDITGFKSSSSTIGYTNLIGFKMYFNKRFFDIFSIDGSEIFGHVMHESMHRFGFAHKSGLFRSKRSTVPYLVGYRSRDAYKEYYSHPIETPFLGQERPVKFVFKLKFVFKF